MMTIEQLIESASGLHSAAPVEDSGTDVAAEHLASRLTALMEAEPTIDALVPVAKRDMMRNNHVNHFKYMDSAVRIFEPTTFVRTVLWALRTYRSHGFAVGYWEKMLPYCMEVIQSETRGDGEHLLVYYKWMLDNLESLAALSVPDGSEGELEHGEH